MADESQYSVNTETTPTQPSLKRKYNDDRSTDPEMALLPTSYNNVPPPATTLDFELAKQRAQEVATRLLSGAPPVDPKRPKLDNNSCDSLDVKGLHSTRSISSSTMSYSRQGIGAIHKIDIPNWGVGIIIGKGGETIKYLQLQSGAKIQVTHDMDADLNSNIRSIELIGSPDAITSAKKLINEVLAKAENRGSNIVVRRMIGSAGSDEVILKIPNNKVGLLIGKGGETIKNIQASSGTWIQVIPLHLPPGDTSTERTLKIEGTPEQIEYAKQLVHQIINGENHRRNPAMSGGYSQKGYQDHPSNSWAPPPTAMQQLGYGYVQSGEYFGPSPKYNMPCPPYAGYHPLSFCGYFANLDQSSTSTQQNLGSPTPLADGTVYNYIQPLFFGYNQLGQCYAQDGYGAYHVPLQSAYGQPPSYDQQQGYNSALSDGMGSNSAQEGRNPIYGPDGDSA